jgi:hypothetical protein
MLLGILGFHYKPGKDKFNSSELCAIEVSAWLHTLTAFSWVIPERIAMVKMNIPLFLLGTELQLFSL